MALKIVVADADPERQRHHCDGSKSRLLAQAAQAVGKVLQSQSMTLRRSKPANRSRI